MGAGQDGVNIGAYGIGCDANSIVGVDGNDFTGDGSQNNPLRYIGTAVSNATTGAKIKIFLVPTLKMLQFQEKTYHLLELVIKIR